MKNKEIKDERLQTKRLKNTKNLFIIQNILILGFIVVQTIYNGYSSLSKNPLLFIFLVTSVIMSFQEMTITRDTTKKNPLIPIAIGLFSIVIVATIVFFVFIPKVNAYVYFGTLVLSIILVFLLSLFILKRRNDR
ncbi:hypothetical protein [Ligilactobacillus acidipiscis]|uniref:hypothetical protein n=1 Tax=Ligilactobacillus acidipiscis TaxID=89059 RepID=UPI000704B19B|nr:hypothetical protein [Ligilactobacillus acidipiscis]GAW65102.1 hypothetical protein Lacidipiscis_02331 [Ligilactobacillus acidipiscis]GEN21726.1 hypothetical protein LAC02_50070 [Ligilactobacillus acidipiscis]